MNKNYLQQIIMLIITLKTIISSEILITMIKIKNRIKIV